MSDRLTWVSILSSLLLCIQGLAGRSALAGETSEVFAGGGEEGVSATLRLYFRLWG